MGSLSPTATSPSSGRSKDLIITGGYNVYPKEIELAIDELPGVRGVRGGRRAASGLRRGGDGGGGARTAAQAPSEREIIAALKAKLADFKVPKRVHSWTSCRATPWARCRRTCCASASRRTRRPRAPSARGRGSARGCRACPRRCSPPRGSSRGGSRGTRRRCRCRRACRARRARCRAPCRTCCA